VIPDATHPKRADGKATHPKRADGHIAVQFSKATEKTTPTPRTQAPETDTGPSKRNSTRPTPKGRPSRSSQHSGTQPSATNDPTTGPHRRRPGVHIISVHP